MKFRQTIPNMNALHDCKMMKKGMNVVCFVAGLYFIVNQLS